MTRQQLKRAQIAVVRLEGIKAFKEGEGRENNPYPSKQEALNFIQWFRGFDDAAWEAQCRVDASYERMRSK